MNRLAEPITRVASTSGKLVIPLPLKVRPKPAIRVAGGWAIGVLAIAYLWACMPTLWPLILDWQRDEDYSVGQLVPFVLVYLFWSDRRRLSTIARCPCGWGLAVIALGQAIVAAGLALMYESIERYGMVVTGLGLVLLLGGKRFFWAYKWLMLFAFLMVPLPGRIHNMISGPLQSVAASGAVITLELLGVTVSQEGNVMVLNHRVPVAVAEACSGLRMLTAFVIVAAVIAFVIKRPGWQKAALVVSSIPVAIICNLIRLVVTALLFLVVSGEWAERFHDIAGWAMMPLAVFILIGEMWIMQRAVIEDDGTA